jgi:hypothetical protein
MKTIIHVNTHTVQSNRTYKRKDPVLTVKQKGSTMYAHEVELTGPSRVVYSPDKPLSCGAHVWMETEFPVHAAKWFRFDELEMNANRKATS